MKKLPYPFVPPRSYPNSFILVVHLRGAPSRVDRRAFFGRMHGEARRHGLVMGHKLGLCVFLGAESLCTTMGRGQMLTWAIDHPEVASVEVGSLGPIAALIQARPRGALHLARPHNARLVRQVAWGTVRQWVAYLWGAM